MTPYPIFLINLDHRHCIVIGGGIEAQYKVAALRKAEAQLTVISPTLTPKLQRWADKAYFTWLKRDYRAGDLRGAFLVIAERSAATRNRAIAAEAERERALYNVMDDVDNCNFVAGSVIRRGPLTIAISTSGAAPAYSVRLRERFQNEFGAHHGRFLELLQSLREPMAAAHPCFKQRRKIWYAIVDSDLLDLIAQQDDNCVTLRLRQLAGDDVVDMFKGDLPLPPAPARGDICDHQCRLPAAIDRCPAQVAAISNP